MATVNENMPQNKNSEINSKDKFENNITEINDFYDTNIINLQQELEILRKRNELLLNTSVDGFWDWDIVNNTTFFSDNLYDILGLDKSQTSPTQFLIDDYIHPSEREIRKQNIINCLNNGVEYNFEYRLKVKSGEYRYFMSRGKVERDENNKPIRMIGTLIDINEKIKYQHRLELKNYIIEHTTTAILWFDKKGNIIRVNSAAEKLYGYLNNEFIKLNIVEIEFQFNEELWNSEFKDIQDKSEITFNSKHIKKNGEIFDVESLANYFLFEDQEIIFAYIKDTTDFNITNKSLKLYEYVIQNTLTPVVWITKEGKITNTNKSYLDLLGYTYDEFVGKDMSHLDDDYSGELWLKHWDELKQKKTIQLYTKSKKKDGSKIDVQVIANYIKFEDIELNCAFVNDITETLKLEKKLKENEYQLNTLIENIPIGIQFLDKNGSLFRYNKGFEDLFGIKHGTNHGYGVNVLTHPVMEALGVSGYYQEVYNEKKSVTFTTQTELEESRKYNFENSFKTLIVKNTTFPILDENGEIDFVASFMEDVTENVNSQNSLIESKNRLRAVIESTKDIVFAVDKEFNYLTFNQNHFNATKAVYGTEVEVGKKMLDYVLNEKDRISIEANIRKSFEGEFVSVIQEYGNDYKIYLEASANPIYNIKNEISGAAVFVRDITQRIKAENEIKEISNRLKAVVESTKDSMYAIDTNLNFLIFNQNFFNSIKSRFDIEISLGSSFYQILEKRKDRDYVLDILKRGLSGEYVEATQELYNKDNQKYYTEVFCNPIYNSNNEITGLAVFIKDITDKRKNELALKVSEQRFRKLLNDIPNVAVQGYNRDGIIIYWNKASETFYGYSSEEAIGQNLYKLLTPEENLEEVINDSEWMFENKTPLPTEEYTVKKKDGNNITVLASNAYVELSDGTPELFCIDVDLTEIKAAEQEIKDLLQDLIQKNELIEINLEQKNSLLNQLEITNQKLSEIISEKDKLFSIIAHDLRSPLSGFMGLSKEMAENIEELTQEQIIEFAKSLQKSSENVYLLLENLLKWSQFQRGTIEFNPEIIYLKFLIENNLSILQSKALYKDIKLINNINSEMSFIGDVKMFNVVLRNLLSNAIKFTPRGGKISIGIVDETNQYFSNTKVTIYIRDTGIGIPKEMINGLFNVNSNSYRTGTENEASSGLGLVLCKEFIAKHNGNIYVESEVGIGTTFYVSVSLKV